MADGDLRFLDGVKKDFRFSEGFNHTAVGAREYENSRLKKKDKGN